jgi:hypothetical protein
MKSVQEEPQLLGDRPGSRLGGAHHQGPRQVHDVPRPGDEHLRNSCEKDGVGGLELQILCGEESSIHVGDKQENADQAQGELMEEWGKLLLPPISPDCNH